MKKLDEIILDIANKKEVILLQDTDLIVELGFDSLSFIQLISEIEEKFEIEIDLEEIDLEVIRNYEELKQLIINKI